LEQHPELPLPYLGRGGPYCPDLTFSDFLSSEDPRADMAAARRALGVGVEKGDEGQYFNLKGNLHGLYFTLTAFRKDVCERVVTGRRELVVEEPDPAAVAALPKVARAVVVEDILNASIGVLAERGRAFGDYGGATGPVCGLGAIAVAAGLEPEAWRYLSEDPEALWSPAEVAMVAAARRLLATVAPWLNAYDTPLDDLISVVGDWYDRATDNELFGALLLAGLPLVPALPLPEQTGAVHV
jgi:hypothetical protein